MIDTHISTKFITKWLWRQYAGIRGPVLLRMVLSALRVVVGLLFIIVCKRLVDIVTHRAAGEFAVWAAMMVACVAVQLLLSAWVSRISVRSVTDYANRLRFNLFDRVLKARWAELAKIHSADALERLKKDVDIMAELQCNTIPTALVTGFQLIAAFVLLAWLDWRLALVMTVIMPSVLLMSRIWVYRMRRLNSDIRQCDSEIGAHMQEHIHHHSTVAAYSMIGSVTQSLDSIQRREKELVLQRNSLSIKVRMAVQIGFALGYATAFLWGVLDLRDGTITFGVMTAFLQLVAQIQRPAVELSRQLPTFINAVTSIERLGRLENISVESDADCRDLSGPLGVRMDNVGFSYPGSGVKAVENISFSIEPGTMVALTGTTGIGKTTLLRLLLGFVKPDSGKVDLISHGKAYKAGAGTRCNIIYVAQDNTLLSGTVRQNLLMGDPDATEAQLNDALNRAMCGFVHNLPEGLDTSVSEGGVGFSEGQARRIAIARGLLRRGGLMLLDEPTSALDPATEAALMKNLAALAPEKTIIVVTHRESTAAACMSRINLA